MQFFFFDEEEDDLRGSRAWVKSESFLGMLGLLNFEMVGMGDQLACWPCSANSNSGLLQNFEEVCLKANVPSHRFDMLIFNAGDHQPFIEAGIEDAFCITSVSQQGLEVAEHYYKAMEFDVDSDTLWEIFQKAPLFEHYHKPTDRSHYLNEESLQRVAEMSWQTLLKVDRAEIKNKKIIF